MTDLHSLLERVEASSGPDVPLDCDLHAELVASPPRFFTRISWPGAYLMYSTKGGRTWSERVPAYTSSLDAAVALVEAKLPGSEYALEYSQGRWSSNVSARNANLIIWNYSQGKQWSSGPLALIAALLRAMIAEKEKTDADAEAH